MGFPTTEGTPTEDATKCGEPDADEKGAESPWVQ